MVIIDGRAGGAVSAFKDVQKEAAKSTSLLGKLADKAGVSGSTLKTALGVGAAAGLVALGAAAAASVQKFLSLVNTVDDFQDVSGASAREASQLVNVVKQLGIAPQTAAKAFFILGKNVGTGKSTLDQYGIAVAKSADGTTDLVGTLANVSAAYRASNDGATRNAIAFAAFGRSAGELPDLLDLTGQQLRSLGSHGPIFTQQDIDNAKQLQINVRAFGMDIDKYQAKAGAFFADNLLSFAGGVGKIEEFLHVIPKGAAVAGLANRQAAAAASLMTDAQRREAAALEETKKVADKLGSSLFGTKNAQLAVAAASRNVVTSQADVAAKQRDLNELLKRGAVDAKEVAAAERSLESATRAQASAAGELVEAQEALNKALAGPSADDKADANLSLKESTLGVAEAENALADARARLAALESGTADPLKVAQAAQRVADAQTKLRRASTADKPAARLDLEAAERALLDAQQEGVATAADLEDARLDLAGAELSLERAQRDQAAAQKAVTDLDPASAASTKLVEDARRALDTAERGVADAQRQTADAQAALMAAQAGDPEFNDKVAAAKRGVRDAEQNVADAKWNHVQAAWALKGAVENEAALLGGAGDAADRLRGQLVDIARIYPSLAPLLGGLIGKVGGGATPGAALDFLPGQLRPRAAGGPVGSGQSYLIGERGPEVLRMGSGSGYVHANSSGSSTTININMPAGSDGDAVVAAIRRYERRNGPGWRN